MADLCPASCHCQYLVLSQHPAQRSLQKLQELLNALSLSLCMRTAFTRVSCQCRCTKKALGAGTYVTYTDAPQTHQFVQQRLAECLTFSFLPAELQELYKVYVHHTPLGQVSSMYLHERIEGFIDHRHQHSVHNEAGSVIGVAHSLAQVLCKAISSLVDLIASTPASLSMYVR